jgi:hypothetical protein
MGRPNSLSASPRASPPKVDITEPTGGLDALARAAGIGERLVHGVAQEVLGSARKAP